MANDPVGPRKKKDSFLNDVISLCFCYRSASFALQQGVYLACVQTITKL